MNYLELFGVASTLIGIAFGFGTQSNRIATLRRDTNSIGDLHRITLDELHGIKIELAGLKKDIEYIKAKTYE